MTIVLMRWLLAAMLMAGAAGPSFAAENLDCVDAGMTDAQRDSFYVSHQTGGSVDEGVFGVLRACATQHGWSDDAQRHALSHAFGINSRRTLLRTSPFTPMQLRTAESVFVSAVTQVEARALLESSMPDAAWQRLTQALLAAGLPVNEENGLWMGEYFAATQMVWIGRIDFAAA